MGNCFDQLSKEELTMYSMASCYLNVLDEPQYRHCWEILDINDPWLQVTMNQILHKSL